MPLVYLDIVLHLSDNFDDAIAGKVSFCLLIRADVWQAMLHVSTVI